MKKRTKEERWDIAGQIWGILGTLLDAALRVLLLVAIVYTIYNGALKCYDYGYRIFTEKPVSSTTGKDITVTIPVDFTPKELGELFESEGLSRDKWLLMLQYYCSEYRENVKSGTYTLSTTMTAEEMFASIAEINIEKDKLRESQDNLLVLDEPEVIKEDEDSDAGSEEDTESEGQNIQEIDGNSDLDDFLEDDIR